LNIRVRKMVTSRLMELVDLELGLHVIYHMEIGAIAYQRISIGIGLSMVNAEFDLHVHSHLHLESLTRTILPIAPPYTLF
jgi:hypothetical protein